MRAGTQTLFQALQAMPWREGPGGDSSDDDTPNAEVQEESRKGRRTLTACKSRRDSLSEDFITILAMLFAGFIQVFQEFDRELFFCLYYIPLVWHNPSQGLVHLIMPLLRLTSDTQGRTYIYILIAPGPSWLFLFRLLRQSVRGVKRNC